MGGAAGVGAGAGGGSVAAARSSAAGFGWDSRLGGSPDPRGSSGGAVRCCGWRAFAPMRRSPVAGDATGEDAVGPRPRSGGRGGGSGGSTALNSSASEPIPSAASATRCAALVHRMRSRPPMPTDNPGAGDAAPSYFCSAPSVRLYVRTSDVSPDRCDAVRCSVPRRRGLHSPLHSGPIWPSQHPNMS